MVDEISADELEKKVGEAQILDVREDHEVDQTDGGFVPTATHVPMSRLPAEMDEYDWNNEIYIICRHGNSSVQAARLLMSYQGVDTDAVVASVAGGYLDWEGKLVYCDDCRKEAAVA
jgi:Rhodanese-related sulfurtransferase